MVLHTLNASPADDAFKECLALLSPGDALVLMGDGVYCALDATESLAQLQASETVLYALAADAVARGVSSRLSDTRLIDLGELVGLTEQFPRQLAWY